MQGCSLQMNAVAENLVGKDVKILLGQFKYFIAY